MEAVLLRAICADATWLSRARDRIAATQFEVPAYRAIYEALLAASAAAPPSAIADQLAPEHRDSFARLLEASERADGYRWDEEFSAAAEALEVRALEREIAALPDPAERARRYQELSAQAQARRWHKKPAEQARRPSRARDERADSP
jgi:hypothetical protein